MRRREFIVLGAATLATACAGGPSTALINHQRSRAMYDVDHYRRKLCWARGRVAVGARSSESAHPRRRAEEESLWGPFPRIPRTRWTTARRDRSQRQSRSSRVSDGHMEGRARDPGGARPGRFRRPRWRRRVSRKADHSRDRRRRRASQHSWTSGALGQARFLLP